MRGRVGVCAFFFGGGATFAKAPPEAAKVVPPGACFAGRHCTCRTAKRFVSMWAFTNQSWAGVFFPLGQKRALAPPPGAPQPQHFYHSPAELPKLPYLHAGQGIENVLWDTPRDTNAYYCVLGYIPEYEHVIMRSRIRREHEHGDYVF